MSNSAAVRLPCTSDIPAASAPFDPHLGGAEGWIDAIRSRSRTCPLRRARKSRRVDLPPGPGCREVICSHGWSRCNRMIGEREFPCRAHRAPRAFE